MGADYAVYFGDNPVGKVQVIRQGLYYRFHCCCQVTGDVMCRLMVSCGKNQENLGVVIPRGDGFGLDTQIPVKRLGEGEMCFRLVAKHEQLAKGTFIPIAPEEPFAYISRLKESFLVRQGNQVGILIDHPEVQSVP